ncbi:hypothetical protein LP418_13030 [Nocardioides sp. B-3]|nr:hypothetical protein [Nocardioides sp. B-3]UUZ61407.1 hypothetical protein LP418_13030 [Nocardioides sp. B-3]
MGMHVSPAHQGPGSYVAALCGTANRRVELAQGSRCPSLHGVGRTERRPNVRDPIADAGPFREPARRPEMAQGEVDVAAVAEHDPEGVMGVRERGRVLFAMDRRSRDRCCTVGLGEGQCEEGVASRI